MTTRCTCDKPADPPDIPHRPWCATQRSDLYWQGYHEAQQRIDDTTAPSKAELERLVATVDEWAMGYRDGLKGANR